LQRPFAALNRAPEIQDAASFMDDWADLIGQINEGNDEIKDVSFIG